MFKEYTSKYYLILIFYIGLFSNVYSQENPIYFRTGAEDKISLLDDRLGDANMYGLGVEANTLYYKSLQIHRWYINSNADDGASSIMSLYSDRLKLDSSSGLYVSSNNSWVGHSSGNNYFRGNSIFAELSSNSKVGIGTNAPIAKVDIAGLTYLRNAPTHDIETEQLRIGRTDSNLRYHSIFSHHSELGKDNYIKFKVHNGQSNGNGYVVQETIMTLFGSGQVGIGTDLSENGVTNDYNLYVTKGIRTEKVKVDVADGSWADYVFEEDYKLTSLQEVESYIKVNKHLPNIPSAGEIEKEGLNLGEMDAKLLQKVEELTLYLIEQHKEIENLKNENRHLIDRLNALDKK